MVLSKTFCPKCGCGCFHIYDSYVATYMYFVHDETRMVEPMGMLDGVAEHVRTECVCNNCGYSWHPRKLDYTIDNDFNDV